MSSYVIQPFSFWMFKTIKNKKTKTKTKKPQYALIEVKQVRYIGSPEVTVLIPL